MELGSGTGIVGIAAAHVGAKVTLTDRPELQPLLAENMARNSIAGKALVLEWGAGSLGELDGVHFDVLLIADPVYALGQVTSLVATVQQILSQNPGCRVFLAHRHRHKHVDDALFDALETLQVKLCKVAMSAVDKSVAVYMTQ